MRKVSTVRSIIGYVIIASFSCLRILWYTINAFFQKTRGQPYTLRASTTSRPTASLFGVSGLTLYASVTRKTLQFRIYQYLSIYQQFYRCCDSWPRTFHRISNQSIRSSTIAKKPRGTTENIVFGLDLPLFQRSIRDRTKLLIVLRNVITH